MGAGGGGVIMIDRKEYSKGDVVSKITAAENMIMGKLSLCIGATMEAVAQAGDYKTLNSPWITQVWKMAAGHSDEAPSGVFGGDADGTEIIEDAAARGQGRRGGKKQEDSHSYQLIEYILEHVAAMGYKRSPPVDGRSTDVLIPHFVKSELGYAWIDTHTCVRLCSIDELVYKLVTGTTTPPDAYKKGPRNMTTVISDLEKTASPLFPLDDPSPFVYSVSNGTLINVEDPTNPRVDRAANCAYMFLPGKVYDYLLDKAEAARAYVDFAVHSGSNPYVQMIEDAGDDGDDDHPREDASEPSDERDDVGSDGGRSAQSRRTGPGDEVGAAVTLDDDTARAFAVDEVDECADALEHDVAPVFGEAEGQARAAAAGEHVDVVLGDSDDEDLGVGIGDSDEEDDEADVHGAESRDDGDAVFDDIDSATCYSAFPLDSSSVKPPLAVILNDMASASLADAEEKVAKIRDTVGDHTSPKELRVKFLYAGFPSTWCKVFKDGEPCGTCAKNQPTFDDECAAIPPKTRIFLSPLDPIRTEEYEQRHHYCNHLDPVSARARLAVEHCSVLKTIFGTQQFFGDSDALHGLNDQYRDAIAELDNDAAESLILADAHWKKMFADMQHERRRLGEKVACGGGVGEADKTKLRNAVWAERTARRCLRKLQAPHIRAGSLPEPVCPTCRFLYSRCVLHYLGVQEWDGFCADRAVDGSTPTDFAWKDGMAPWLHYPHECDNHDKIALVTIGALGRLLYPLRNSGRIKNLRKISVLLGASGCGKSVVLDAVMRLLRRGHVAVMASRPSDTFPLEGLVTKDTRAIVCADSPLTPLNQTDLKGITGGDRLGVNRKGKKMEFVDAKQPMHVNSNHFLRYTDSAGEIFSRFLYSIMRRHPSVRDATIQDICGKERVELLMAIVHCFGYLTVASEMLDPCTLKCAGWDAGMGSPVAFMQASVRVLASAWDRFLCSRQVVRLRGRYILRSRLLEVFDAFAKTHGIDASAEKTDDFLTQVLARHGLRVKAGSYRWFSRHIDDAFVIGIGFADDELAGDKADAPAADGEAEDDGDLGFPKDAMAAAGGGIASDDLADKDLLFAAGF
jgi:hypothetical protein